MLIETFLKEIDKKGISLFTKYPLKEGQVIYEDCDIFSKKFTDSEFDKLSANHKEFIRIYGCYIKAHKTWYLDTDNGRFMNHSETPNVTYDWGTYLEGGKGTMIALKDIPTGTELCSNYRLHSDQFKDTLLFADQV